MWWQKLLSLVPENLDFWSKVLFKIIYCTGMVFLASACTVAGFKFSPEHASLMFVTTVNDLSHYHSFLCTCSQNSTIS
jgi:hypothetical protein